MDEQIREGDLARAQVLCKRLLQQHPTNAAAHEKMGDIMRRRELWEDAAEWYGLAGQLQDSERLRAKRADAVQRAREARRGGLGPHLVEDAERPRKLLLWLGIAAVAMVLIALAIVRGLTGPDVDQERVVVAPPETVDTGPAAPGGPGLTSPSPVRGTQPAPAPPGGQTAQPPQPGEPGDGGAREIPGEHWSASPAPRQAPRRTVSTRPSAAAPRTAGIPASVPTTDHDRAVIAATEALTWGTDRPMTGTVNAIVDPYSGYAVIRVMIPGTVAGDGMVEQVVRQAYRVARAAIAANETITSLTIQMVRIVDGERVLAFRGNTTRRALQNVQTQQPDFGTIWDGIFASAWWNEQAGGAGPAATEETPATTP